MIVLWNLPWNIYLTKSNLKYNNTSFLSHFWAFKAGVFTLFVLHYLTVTDEVRPPFQNRTLKTTGCISTSITSNVFLPNALHPSQDPLVSPGTVNIPLVNNRKGCLLHMRLGPGDDPSQLRFSISGPEDVATRSLAESRLNRARSLPVKYRCHPSNAMLLSHSRHCRLAP